MNKVFIVALREFVETVRTKTFIFSSVVMPLLVIGLIYGGERIAKMAEREKQPPRTLGVADRTGIVLEYLQEQIDQHNKENPTRQFILKPLEASAERDDLAGRVRTRELYACLIIPADALRGDGACELLRADTRLETAERIKRMLNRAVAQARFARAEPPIDYARVQQLERPVTLNLVDAASGRRTSGMAEFFTPFAFMFLLFMGTMNISQGLLTSLIEEKSSRVIEVLLSAVSPLQLMAGKILGMVAVGMLVIAIWTSVGYVSAHWRGMENLVTLYRVGYVVAYFIPGFLLIAAMLAAVGSACNTLKDAQSLAFPLTIITIIPLMLWWTISQNPNSTLSVLLSYIPPITPFIMVLRICADPQIALWQIVTTLALLWLCVFAVVWAAAKIFRVGILMYGKPPSFGELLRWVRVA